MEKNWGKKNILAIVLLIAFIVFSIIGFATSYVFTPEYNIRAVDHSFLIKDNIYHLFYIHTNLSINGGSWVTDPNEDFFGHVTSQDLVNWTNEPHVINVGPIGSWDSKNVWAPHIIQYDGIYYMFYTGVNYSTNAPSYNAQKIGVATSTDLYNWQKYSENPVVDCGNFSWTLYNPEIAWGGDCRDPMVYHDLVNNRFIMYFFADRFEGRSVVGYAYSSDLLHWSEGSYIETTLGRRPESPFLLDNPYDNKYYLFYSGYEGVEYAVSDTPDGDFVNLGMFGDSLNGFATEVPRMHNVIFYTNAGNGVFYRMINLRKLVWDEQTSSFSISDLENCDVIRCGGSSPIFSPILKLLPLHFPIQESTSNVKEKKGEKPKSKSTLFE